MPRPRRATLRTSALFYAGALALHELRYLVGWGSGADRALADQGHAYLTYAMPWAVALAAAGVGQVVWRLAGPRGRGDPDRRGDHSQHARQAVAWLAASCGLLAIYASQEGVEGLLAPGHPFGLAGVCGHGGLVAIPLALALGGAIVLAELGARAALTGTSPLAVAVAARLRPAPDPVPAGLARPAPRRASAAAGVLAAHLAGRAPPAARA